MFCSDLENITKFIVMDEGIYLSDHKPVMVNYLCEFNLELVRNNVSKSVSDPVPVVERFRRDHANVMLYYNDTGEQLQNILPAINDLNLENFAYEDSAALVAYHIYNNIVYVLTTSANKFIPKRQHNFYKFWCNQKNNKSISSNNLQKAAGKPHNGPIYDQHKSDKRAYKLRVKDEMQRELNCYSNDFA